MHLPVRGPGRRLLLCMRGVLTMFCWGVYISIYNRRWLFMLHVQGINTNEEGETEGGENCTHRCGRPGAQLLLATWRGRKHARRRKRCITSVASRIVAVRVVFALRSY